MVKRLAVADPRVLLSALVLATLAWASPLAAQASPCPELQCRMPDGTCGWPANGGCYSTIEEAECRQAGGCDWVGGSECYVPADDGGCYPIPKAECIDAGGIWRNGECVAPEPGTVIEPEPQTLGLLTFGVLVIFLLRYRRRRDLET